MGCGCTYNDRTEPPKVCDPNARWEFFPEDGRKKGYNYFIIRAVHPVHGSIWRMWGWIPSDDEIEKFKKDTEMEK